jgi:hypothetical protein
VRAIRAAALGSNEVCVVLVRSNSSQGPRRRRTGATNLDLPSPLQVGEVPRLRLDEQVKIQLRLDDVWVEADGAWFALGAPMRTQTGRKWSTPSAKLCVASLAAPLCPHPCSVRRGCADEPAMHVANAGECKIKIGQEDEWTGFKSLRPRMLCEPLPRGSLQLRTWFPISFSCYCRCAA